MVRLDWRDYVAIFIASLETVALPMAFLIIFLIVLLLLTHV